jgi:hypothetical protein
MEIAIIVLACCTIGVPLGFGVIRVMDWWVSFTDDVMFKWKDGK